MLKSNLLGGDESSGCGGGGGGQGSENLSLPTLRMIAKDPPKTILYKKMESILAKMQDSGTGVSIKTVKSILTKIPDVFSGEDMVMWLGTNLEVSDQEAVHLGSLIAAHGYFFPIDDHVITLKNDGSFYRFQTTDYWPSKGWEPDNTEYAVYLCKRTMQNKARLELADYEAENLARLQRTFSKTWEAIYARAEQEAKRDRKRDKIPRKVLDSQERAFWDVHRPVPACVNTTEVDIKKTYYSDRQKRTVYNSSPRKNAPSVHASPANAAAASLASGDAVQRDISAVRLQLKRHCLKMSKVCDSLNNYVQQHNPFDPLLPAAAHGDVPNPWIVHDDSEWVSDADREISYYRALQWKFSFGELLRDVRGQSEFRRFLEKEFSAENLNFWLACKELKSRPVKELAAVVEEIYGEYMAEETPNPINVDSKIKESVLKRMNAPDRYCFEEAQDHIYNLMKTDSYARFLKSDQYNVHTQSKQQLEKLSRASSRGPVVQTKSPYSALVNEPHSE